VIGNLGQAAKFKNAQLWQTDNFILPSFFVSDFSLWQGSDTIVSNVRTSS
jgi:hypothetical protein